jgi:hypothetical protein
MQEGDDEIGYMIDLQEVVSFEMKEQCAEDLIRLN